MRVSKDFESHVLMPLSLAVCLIILIVGCTDREADQRARICKHAGLAVDVVNQCRRSQEDYNHIMEPIRARQELEEAAAFNAGLKALPSSIIPKDRYETISIEELNTRHECCFQNYTDAREAVKHPLFSKRYRILGEISYHEKDSEGKPDGRVSIQAEDVTDRKTTWHLDADIESLSREERSLIRRQCAFLYAFDDCTGEFFGVIGRIERGELEVLGLQIEHMKLKPREAKKTS